MGNDQHSSLAKIQRRDHDSASICHRILDNQHDNVVLVYRSDLGLFSY